MVMTEIPVLSLTIVAILFYFRFAETGKTKDLILLVVSFVLACYAKQMAIFALPVFVVHFALRRGVRALFSLRLIVAFAVLTILLIPLVIMTLRFSVTNISWVVDANVNAGFSLPGRQAFYFLQRMWEDAFVVPVVALGFFGMIVAVLSKRKESLLFLLWIAASATLVVYMRLLDPRMAVYWLPPFALFAALSPRLVASARGNFGIVTPKQTGSAMSALLFGCVAYQVVTAYAANPDYTEGYEEAAKFVAQERKGATILFSSTVDTGYFVFFTRKHDPQRELIVLRANKILATSFYNETVEEQISNVEEIYRLLHDYGTCYIVHEETDTDSRALNWLQQELDSDRFVLRKHIPLKTSERRLQGVSLFIHEYRDCTPPRPDAPASWRESTAPPGAGPP